MATYFHHLSLSSGKLSVPSIGRGRGRRNKGAIVPPTMCRNTALAWPSTITEPRPLQPIDCRWHSKGANDSERRPVRFRHLALTHLQPLQETAGYIAAHDSSVAANYASGPEAAQPHARQRRTGSQCQGRSQTASRWHFEIARPVCVSQVAKLRLAFPTGAHLHGNGQKHALTQQHFPHSVNYENKTRPARKGKPSCVFLYAYKNRCLHFGHITELRCKLAVRLPWRGK